MTNELTVFCKKIFYNFNNISLLEEALTHPSICKEKKMRSNYQRLEFLGDKVLSLIISVFLMRKFTNEAEGPLSKRHANLVSGDTLAEIALNIGLDKVLQLSFGEEKLGGKTNKRNLENTLEALVGAIYLDSNYDNAKNFVLTFWQNYLDQNHQPPQDSISKLQELIQASSRELPNYQTIKEGGLDHAPVFISQLTLPNHSQIFTAKGSSKKEAQKNVAKTALDFLQSKVKNQDFIN
jgi:ribonuclease-3